MDHLNVSESELKDEIEALQKQAEQAQIAYRDTIMKIEGALQFAHHLLTQVSKEDHQTVAEAKE